MHDAGSPRDSEPDPGAQRLTSLLCDLRFPARKWELTTYAEDRGADGTSRGELAGLPEGLYRDLDAVVSMVAAARHAAIRQIAANCVIPGGAVPDGAVPKQVPSSPGRVRSADAPTR